MRGGGRGTWPATGPLWQITWRGSGIGFVVAMAARMATRKAFGPILKPCDVSDSER
jgi:hypothetical protein